MRVIPFPPRQPALHARLAIVMRELIALIAERPDDIAIAHLLDAITSAARARLAMRESGR